MFSPADVERILHRLAEDIDRAADTNHGSYVDGMSEGAAMVRSLAAAYGVLALQIDEVKRGDKLTIDALRRRGTTA
jgi:hypothetical protein